MIKGTPELIAGKREEIIKACEKLCQTMSFKEITLKEIGNEVTIFRPTIYNCFKLKKKSFLRCSVWSANAEAIGETAEHILENDSTDEPWMFAPLGKDALSAYAEKRELVRFSRRAEKADERF